MEDLIGSSLKDLARAILEYQRNGQLCPDTIERLSEIAALEYLEEE